MTEHIPINSSTPTTPVIAPGLEEPSSIPGAQVHDAVVVPGETSQAAMSVSEEEETCPEVSTTQARILPLLGKPYFTCIVCKSHVQPPFQVAVPKSLASFLPSRSTPATLTYQGRSWEMRFNGGRTVKRLEAGWRSFAEDNSLRLGDGCVFELVNAERAEFRVQVLRAEIPAAIQDRAGGYTSSSAIVID